MLKNIIELRQEIESKFGSITNNEQLELFRLEYLVKKGKLTILMEKMREVPKEEKPLVGKEMNILRNYTETTFLDLKNKFESDDSPPSQIDLSLPGRIQANGSLHPIMQTMDDMINIFEKMGFNLAEGPDIEDGFHNFDALNFPADHPARDMQDTFFVEDKREIVLRTHTSPVQVQLMQSQKPPIRSIMPGRVYRNEALDATHLAEFHQIEGLYIDENVTFAELKATMIVFAKEMYGSQLEFRFRPSFFPFTEPSAELDIRVPGSDKWMEVAGCGMVHPNVFKAAGIDTEKYSGYAFGFGIERVTMLKTQLKDIRLLYENDIRVLEQF